MTAGRTPQADPAADRWGYQWSCGHCGPSPDSHASWCARGCGRDYNRMTLVQVMQERAADPAADLAIAREALEAIADRGCHWDARTAQAALDRTTPLVAGGGDSRE